MSTQILVRHLWEAQIVVLAILMAVLLIRKNWSKFPIFSAYLTFCLTQGTVLYILLCTKLSLYISSRQWIREYWIAEVIGIILGFGVIYEVFRKLLASYSALRNLANTVFRWAFVVLVILGSMVLYVKFSPNHAHSAQAIYSNAMFVVEEAVRTTEVGLLLFLFMFAGAFGLHWRHSLFGIALGFGLFISIELIAVTMRSHLPAGFNIVRMLTFTISLLIWLGYQLVPESAKQRTDLPKLAQLEQWNQALMELIHQ